MKPFISPTLRAAGQQALEDRKIVLDALGQSREQAMSVAEKLRGDPPPYLGGLMRERREAADALDAQAARIAALEAEVARLREALKVARVQFANIYDAVMPDAPAIVPAHIREVAEDGVRDIRAALEAGNG